MENRNTWRTNSGPVDNFRHANASKAQKSNETCLETGGTKKKNEKISKEKILRKENTWDNTIIKKKKLWKKYYLQLASNLEFREKKEERTHKYITNQIEEWILNLFFFEIIFTFDLYETRYHLCCDVYFYICIYTYI